MNNKIKSVLIKDTFTIKEVLKKLQKSKFKSQKFCIVENRYNKIIDVLTDGDIRRILLKTENTNIKIEPFLKKKFVFTFQNNSNDNRKIVKSKKINFLPILNKDMTINDIFFLDDYEKAINNEVFFFAGGRGKRMFPLTEILPKPMINIGDLPLIESMINNFRNQGFKNIIISTNYLSNVIKNYFKKKEYFKHIKFIRERKKLGTAGSLSLINTNIDKPIICINGDIYTNLNFKLILDYHIRSKNICTICTRDYKIQIPYGIIEKGKNPINEKPLISKKISAGIYIFNKEVFSLLKKNQYLDMNNFINYLNKKNKKIGFYHIYELLYDVGDLKTYEDVNNYLNSK